MDDGIKLDKPIYSHVSGIDLIRDADGQYRVLEDNLRTPSGVSYMLESRNISETLIKDVFERMSVLKVANYPERLKSCLTHATNKYDPQIVVLTPGRFNSAYYEHAFLAREMNVPLVHGYDLIVEDNKVYIQTVRGRVQVDVIYRRIDDGFLDPLAFRSDSALGVSGLMSAYLAGNVAITNAPGTGVADDKSMYPFVPDMIDFYLGEKPILPNVETYQCRKPDELAYVLDNLNELVVKETQGSGGYGMLIGTQASDAEIAAYRKRLLANPSGFIAQPTIALSTSPTVTEDGIEPRHIDLRPFILSHGNGDVDIVPGGLTRVAMIKDSLVVNSSQGGGIKDTWVVDSSIPPKPKDQPAIGLASPDGKAKLQKFIVDNAKNSSPMLLLSTASCLVWLGRYSERLRYDNDLITLLYKQSLDDNTIARIVAGFGWHITAEPESLYAELLGNQIPSVINAIEENVQDVKGVLGKDTAELYNIIRRLANGGKYQAASLQLYACDQAMQLEADNVFAFWAIGRSFEVLERAILLSEDLSAPAMQMKKAVERLPQNTRWGDLERMVNQLAKSLKASDFNAVSDEFLDILEQGV